MVKKIMQKSSFHLKRGAKIFSSYFLLLLLFYKKQAAISEAFSKPG